MRLCRFDHVEDVMRPTIAVMPLVDDERESLWMLPGYMDALREAGAVPFMPALTTDDEIRQIFAMCDGLLMTGGRYGCATRSRRRAVHASIDDG